MTKNLSYRLGIDLGTNSLGFALVELKHNIPLRPVHMGVRIFTDGRDAKTRVSLAVDRRNARGARRRRDRLVRRQQKLMKELVAAGLMPEDKAERKKLEAADPYDLRKRALDEPLSLYEIGRALFHINQRRGFQSNRKHAAKDKDAGAISDGKIKLEQMLAEHHCRTLGELLSQRSVKRVRPVSQGSKIAYDFYPQRDMLKAEYDMILERQSSYYPDILSHARIEKLKDIIFFQRKLRPVQKGRCSLLPEKERAYAALPSSQRFRILKEVNNLKVMDKIWRRNSDALTDEQRNKAIAQLHKNKKVSFDGLRKTMKFDSSTAFNLESGHRNNLEGATTHITLSNPAYFGERWNAFSLNKQDDIVEKILDDTIDDFKLAHWLRTEFSYLDDTQITAIIDVSLEEGTLRYSREAIGHLLPYLEKGQNEHDAREACKQAGLFPHARGYDGQILSELPYYGELLETHVNFGSGKPGDSIEKRYGKIPNPTVHIALNQLRRLVNELVSRFGKPEEIAIELSRDLKLNKHEKARLHKEHSKNQKENVILNEQIIEAGGRPDNENRLRLKLHKQQGGLCMYSGTALNISDVLSDRAEIDHILPFSRTFDDTAANKVLVLREYNRIKGNLSPYEARDPFQRKGIDYDTLLARTNSLPAAKKWRFLPDALKRFDEETQSGDKGWLARQLNDTSYMARVARDYMRYVVGNVDTYPGGITAKLRKAWAFNSLLNPAGNDEKNRDDHRHHAVDALVIACANRSILNTISTASGKGERIDAEWIKGLMKEAPPYTSYNRDILQDMVDNIVVSHKPDHGNPGQNRNTSGRLHEDTFYGHVPADDLPEDKIRLVVTVPVTSLKEKDIYDIRDSLIKHRLIEAVNQKSEGEKFEHLLSEFSKQNGIHSVRILVEKSRKSMRPVKDKKGNPYRYVATGSNHHIDIYCPIRDKKALKIKAGQWYAETVSTFDANQKGFQPKWRQNHPTAKLVMRLHINDMIAYEENGVREIRRVKKIDGKTERAYLVSHIIADEEGDKLSWAASANLLQKKNARKISVTSSGKVLDPGHAPVPKPFRNAKEAVA